MGSGRCLQSLCFNFLTEAQGLDCSLLFMLIQVVPIPIYVVLVIIVFSILVYRDNIVFSD